MGTGSCKSAKAVPLNQPKKDNKNITICVFGLDDAGKTSTIKAIEGVPTNNVSPTKSSNTIMITYPFAGKNDRIDKTKTPQRIKIIDVNGERKFRQQSWSQYYDQIHGLIFVIDASDRDRFRENQETLEDLLEHDKLKDKPILILANKQDQKGAINNEYDLKRKLNIERLKTKYKIVLCTALPQDHKKKVDESIRDGVSWLIQTIDDNYTALNSRNTKGKNNRQSNRSDSDENEKTIGYRSTLTLEKLPKINTNKNKAKSYSDDEDDHNYISTNSLNKKKKVVGGAGTNDSSVKKPRDNELKAFRSTYESFPEETPWSLSSSPLKTTKSDDMLTRLHTKSSVTSDTRRRDVSPLVRDTKSYTNGSLSKRDNVSDEENDNFTRQQRPTSTSRFDTSSYPASRFSSTVKKTTSGIYDDDDDDYTNTNNRHAITTPKKPYTRDYDDEDAHDDYLKKSTTIKTNKNYDFDDNKTYPRSTDRSNVNSDYRQTATTRSTYDHDNYSTSKPTTRFSYNNDYSTSKSTNPPKYNDDDDDDDYPSTKVATRSKYDNEDRPYSSSKPISRSKYDDDDDYPSSSSKAVTHSKYDDDDEDDNYTTASKKNSYPPPYNNQYGSGGSRTHSQQDDFFTSKNQPNNTNRFRKDTDYDY